MGRKLTFVNQAGFIPNMGTERKTIKGPVRDQVRRNIRRLRERSDMSLAALARKLQDLGHPLGTTAIHKIEQGGRKPDVDDLVAFALALDVSPNVLLLPPAGEGEKVPLTATEAMPFSDAWRWARDGVAAGAPDSWTIRDAIAWEAAHPDQPGTLLLQFSPEARARMTAVAESMANTRVRLSDQSAYEALAQRRGEKPAGGRSGTLMARNAEGPAETGPDLHI